MNTPAHIALNLVLLGRKQRPEWNVPIILGAVLPDLPIMVFYLVEKFYWNLPESVIWSETYYDPGWQAFFDAFNSIPLALAGWLVFLVWKKYRPAIFFASMALHSAVDFLLHHDDAHRHFMPLSTWRFESPVSYWDPEHFGQVVSVLEIAVVIAACMLLWRRFPSSGARRITAGLVGIYSAYWAYVMVVWM